MAGEYGSILDTLQLRRKEDLADDPYLDASRAITSGPASGGFASSLAQGILMGAMKGGLEEAGSREVQGMADERSQALSAYADAIRTQRPEDAVGIENAGILPKESIAAVKLSQAMDNIDPTHGGFRNAPITYDRALIMAKSVKGIKDTDAEQLARDMAASGITTMEARLSFNNLNRQGYHDLDTIEAESTRRGMGAKIGQNTADELYGGAPKPIADKLDKIANRLQHDNVALEHREIQDFAKVARGALKLDSAISDETAKRLTARSWHPRTRVNTLDEKDFDNAMSKLDELRGSWNKAITGGSRIPKNVKLQMLETIDQIERASDENYWENVIAPTARQLNDMSPEALSHWTPPNVSRDQLEAYEKLRSTSEEAKGLRGNPGMQKQHQAILRSGIDALTDELFVADTAIKDPATGKKMILKGVPKELIRRETSRPGTIYEWITKGKLK